MAQPKVPSQVLCPHCAAGNLQGSPHCSSCGSPLNSIVERRAPTMLGAAAQVPRIVTDPISLLTSEGQDREAVKQTYERATTILTAGETIEYIAVAKGGIGHSSDCAVATNKRLLLYRKKVLGKFELDDCYWRDVESLALSDVKGGVNLTLHAIQGWHLLAESIPKPQAARLHQVAITFSDRLRNSAPHSEAQRAGSSFVFLSPQSEPAAPSPSRPLASPPSAPLIVPANMQDVSALGTNPAMQLVEQQPAPTGPRSANTGPAPAYNGAYYIATPESVLQNILQSSALDGELEVGVPTRPMQWSAAAFQAPALTDVQPVTLSEQSSPFETSTHDGSRNAVDPHGAENQAETLSNSSISGLHAGPDPWNYSKNGGGISVPGVDGHDTEPQLRITPPLTTLERIAVFSLSSGSLAHDNGRGPRAAFDPASLPVVDNGLHIVPRLPLATSQATGSMSDANDQSDSDTPVQRDDASDDTLRILAEKISGHLDDDMSFSSSSLHSLHWSMDNTGVIPDHAMDTEITEHISVLLGPDDISCPLPVASSGGIVVPDPPLADADVVSTSSSGQDSEIVASVVTRTKTERPGLTNGSESPVVVEEPESGDSQKDSSAVLPNLSSGPDDEFISIVGLVGESLSSSPVTLAVAPISPDVNVDDDEATFDADSSHSAHPTAPMGSVDTYLPVPGSMTRLSSGPLLAASSHLDHDMEDLYKNTGPMATQRLEGDQQFDQSDRPTSINLTMGSIPNREDAGHDWDAGAVHSPQVQRTASDDQKKPRVGNTANRTASPKIPLDDPIAKMKQLKALLDAGFITDEDYAAKKAEILSRI